MPQTLSTFLGMSVPFPRFLQILENLSSQGYFWRIPFSRSVSCDGSLSFSSRAGPSWIPPAAESYFGSQNLCGGLWDQRAEVAVPHHTSQNTAYNHVLNIPVLSGGFRQTMTGMCLTGQATSYHILVSLHLDGSSVSIVSTICPGLLGTPNSPLFYSENVNSLEHLFPNSPFRPMPTKVLG